MTPARPLHHLLDRIESSTALDEVAERLGTLGEPIRSRRRLHDALTGRWAGHTMHPAVVLVPVGCWIGATVLDVTGPGSIAARRLVGTGILGAGPSIATGLAEWIDTEGAERRVGVAHAIVNNVALAAMVLSWLARRRGATGRGVVLSAVGVTAVGIGGYLGGHLAYVRGVAVNTTAFQSGPRQWERLAPVEGLADGVPARLESGGLAYVAVRRGDRVDVLEDRCSHRGGPLSEGLVVDGCIECPWHGSRFRLDTGEVVRGPGAVPQPAYKTRIVDGWVEIRRDEPGSLRADPVGAGHVGSTDARSPQLTG
jgi:nitrite reductase/ring-hydroxylating ferredoxin subunit/uncharacterized membrane protein